MNLLVASFLLAAAAPPADTPPPVFKAGATLVAVPVFVTDKSGHAVAALTAADFELLDEGRPVPIVAFQAVDADAPRAAGADVPAAVQAVAARQFLLLFDLQFAPPGGLTRAREAAIRFVREGLAPGDLVAVAAFSRTGLRLLTPFTTDRNRVAVVIRSLGLVGAVAAGDPLGLGSGTEVLANSGGAGDSEFAELLGRQQLELKRDYGQRVLDFLGGLGELGRALAPWRGRKQALLFSGGFDQSTWNEVQAPAGAFGRTTVPPAALDTATIQNIRDQMRRTFRTLREADVVLHTVDVSGLQGTMDLANQEGLGQQRGQGRETLQALAENTGGLAVRPTNDFTRALGEVDAASRHYYVLAFAPPDGAGTKPRALKVKVRGSGLSVSHRAAYTLPAPSPEGKDDVLAVAAEAIAKGLTGGALKLDLLALPYRDPRGGLSVPAVLHVDGAALAATTAGPQARMQVYGYALVADQVVDALRLETTLDLAKLGPELRENGLRLLTSFAVPAAGPVDVRFFVRAGAGGTSGSIRRRVDAPAYAAGDAVLLPPLLTVPLAGHVALPLGTQRGAELTLPFRLGAEPFIPGAVRLRAGQGREVCLMAWHVGAPPALPEITAEIAPATGAALPVHVQSPRALDDPDGFARYLLTLVAPDAPPGSYTLRIVARDPASGRTAQSESPVTIE